MLPRSGSRHCRGLDPHSNLRHCHLDLSLSLLSLVDLVTLLCRQARIQELERQNQAQAIQITALQDSLKVALEINLQQISQFKSDLQNQINQTKNELESKINEVKSSESTSEPAVNLMGSPDNVVYSGVEYRTLDGYSPSDTHAGHQVGWWAMPTGWRVASHSAAVVEHVINSHGWGALCMFVDNGDYKTGANLATGQMATMATQCNQDQLEYRPATSWGRPEQYRAKQLSNTGCFGCPPESRILICPISQCGTTTPTIGPTDAPTDAPTTPIWTQAAGFSGQPWHSITSSSDGTKLAAVENGGSIWVSGVECDSGALWTKVAGTSSQQWQSITSSSDGTKLAAVEQGPGGLPDGGPGGIWVSSDSGASWTKSPGTSGQQWQSITSSSDGTKLAAVEHGGSIWVSSDSGASWTKAAGPLSQRWQSITSSSDGTKLAAVENGGSIWVSSDSGASWTKSPGTSGQMWQSITSSSDGTKLAAVIMYAVGAPKGSGWGGSIWVSSDSGASWTQAPGASGQQWQSITSSSDGTKLAAVVSEGTFWFASSSKLYPPQAAPTFAPTFF